MGRGAPKKRSPQLAKLLAAAIKRGIPLTHAASLAGISFQTFCTWRNEDHRFRELIERAVAEGINARLRKIESASEQDWRAAAWLLEHTQPQHFALTRVQVEAVGQFDHTFVVPRETLDQIAEARKLHDERDGKRITQTNRA